MPLRNRCHQSEPPVPWPAPPTHRQVKLKPTLDCKWVGRLTLFPFSLSGTFGITTLAGHLHGRNALGQILHLSDFNNKGDPKT